MSGKREQRRQWRREKVQELSTKGYTQRQISDTLKVALVLVNKDLQYLRIRSKDNIQHYINEQLPAEYESAINTLYDY